jgi:rubrerythrin
MTANTAVLDTLVRAMINEQDGYEFYMEAAKRVKDEKGKAMFRSLASDETEHLRILQAEHGKVAAGQSFADLAAAREELPAKSELTLFPEKSELNRMLRGATNDEQALKVALEFELKGYKMYEAAAQKASDKNAAEVFSYLAHQENQHYALIDKTLRYLQDRGVWFFDDLEMPFFEG